MKKIKVGVLGATGMVGQRFITLLHKHPWFEIAVVAASPKSAGVSYEKAVSKRWKMSVPIPSSIRKMKVLAVERDFDKIVKQVSLVFSALDMDKEDIKEIENKYAKAGIPVISNNSAHRWTEDVPMLMPEINPHHLEIIKYQQSKRGWKKGFIIVKPNCSIQSYVSVLTALMDYQPVQVNVTSMQAISGAGKTFDDWPHMVDNLIPYIEGEEEKSETEPLKIWGNIKNRKIKKTNNIQISATCVRVPITDGHMADVSVKFKKKLTKSQILKAIKKFNSNNYIKKLRLPSAPKTLIHYLEDQDRPQTAKDRDLEGGMAISLGRLRKDSFFDWKFISLSHNTLRGAAGGAVLTAEFCFKKGLIKAS